MEKHPEGGWYAQSWRDGPTATKDGQRGSGSAIYNLLEEGQRSNWHAIDAVEIWHYHAGMPLELSISEDA
ncbi:MAG: cupin domain-containing protein, partial [Pseudomonadota bacterium]